MSFDSLPDGWAIVKLGDIGKWGSGGTPKKNTPDFYDNGTIPWLKIGDLNDGIVNSCDEYITNIGLKNSSAKLLPKNVLLVAMYGSIGKTRNNWF
jgi:type I restriction enzyme, S subunit